MLTMTATPRAMPNVMMANWMGCRSRVRRESTVQRSADKLTVRKPQDTVGVRGGFQAVRDHQQGAVLFTSQAGKQGHHLRPGFFI